MPSPRQLRVIAASWCLVFLPACGDGSPTGPDQGFDLTGQWTLTATELATFDRTCILPPIALTFTKTNGTLGGTMLPGGDGTMICTLGGGAVEVNPLPGLTTFDLVHVDGGKVRLSVTGTSGQSNGGWTIVGDTDGNNRLIGSAIAFRTLIGNPAVYATTTGTWTAQRQ